MVIFLNRNAAGGRALSRWQKIQQQLRGEYIATSQPDEIIKLYRQGKRDFIAAGGDGTVNLLATILINNLTARELQEVTLGAIGIGSSNDYHKAQNTPKYIAGFPCRIDPFHTHLRDVLVIKTESSTHYALLNIGMGFSAQANYTFNKKEGVIAKIKKYTTSLAICISILKTILTYIPQRYIITHNNQRFDAKLHNLNILKSPHIATGICYPFPFIPNSGNAALYMIQNCSIWSFLKTFTQLVCNKFSDELLLLSTFRATAQKPFPIEFDGEVRLTKTVSISIKKSLLRCC